MVGQERSRNHHHLEKEGVVQALQKVAVQFGLHRYSVLQEQIRDWPIAMAISTKKKSNSRRIHFGMLSAGSLPRFEQNFERGTEELPCI